MAIPDIHTSKAPAGYVATHQWLANQTFWGRTERAAINRLLEALGRQFLGTRCPDCNELVRSTNHFISRRPN